MPIELQGEKIVEIGCHLPPKIKVQRDMELYGASGMYLHSHQKISGQADFRSRFLTRLVVLSTEGLILQKICVSID